MTAFRLLLPLFFLVPSLALAAPAVVIKSTAPGFSAGAMVEEGQVIDLPAGASVTLVTPQGATVTRTGPFNGPSLATGAGGDGPVARTLSDFLTKRSNETRVGAVRAAGAREPDDPGVVPVSLSGRFCVPPDGALLWRPAVDGAETYVVRAVGGGQGEVTFERGSPTAAWPADVPVRDGAAYLVRVKDSVRSNRLVLAVAPEEMATPALEAAWMIGQNCTRQAALLIERLAGG